jgi:hypothetical protein
LKQVTAAHDGFARVPATPSRRKARNLVKSAIRKLTAFSHKLNAKKGRNVIPEATRTRLVDHADAIRADMVTFRGTL